VLIHAAPAPHPRFDGLACFRETLADLARGRFGGWANRLERFAATFACRAAIKAGQRLSEPEMRRLLLRLFETELPPHDVHGRATIVQLPREELERRFGRR
jgi:DNA mismatch repair protein MutL